MISQYSSNRESSSSTNSKNLVFSSPGSLHNISTNLKNKRTPGKKHLLADENYFFYLNESSNVNKTDTLKTESRSLRTILSEKDLNKDSLIDTIQFLEEKIHKLETGKLNNSLRAKENISRAMDDLHKKLNSTENLSVSKLKGIVKDNDQMIICLMGEIDNLNALLLEKINHCEKLKELNKRLNAEREEFLEKAQQECNEKVNESRAEMNGLSIYIEELKKENKKLTDAVANLTAINESNETQISFLKSQLEIKEKQNPNTSIEVPNKALGSKIEELVKINDNLNSMIVSREGQISNIFGKLNEQINCNKMLAKQIDDKTRSSDILKQELIKCQNQVQTLTQEISLLKNNSFISQYSSNKSTINLLENTRNFESFITDNNNWQKKFESVKADNEKLAKIIEDNQKIINGFRESFAQLESCHSKQVDEMKKQYEEKMKSLIESCSNNSLLLTCSSIGSNITKDLELTNRKK